MKVRIRLAKERRAVRDVGARLRVDHAKLRQHRAANAIPGVVRIRVRRIRHVRYVILFKPFQYIFSFYGKQWPNHVISPILHAREAAKPRAAHEIMEDGLRLIIEMMRHRDPGGGSPHLLPRGLEGLVTEDARGLLEAESMLRRVFWSRDMHRLKRDSELRAELLRKRLIAVRLRATDAVMDMHRPQRKAQPRLQRVQRIQQEDRIRTARKADHDAIARADQLIRPDISFDFQHKRIHATLLSKTKVEKPVSLHLILLSIFLLFIRFDDDFVRQLQSEDLTGLLHREFLRFYVDLFLFQFLAMLLFVGDGSIQALFLGLIIPLLLPKRLAPDVDGDRKEQHHDRDADDRQTVAG